jgi:transcription elongation GreA/GreB family factor
MPRKSTGCRISTWNWIREQSPPDIARRRPVAGRIEAAQDGRPAESHSGDIREIDGKLSHAQVIDVTRLNADGRVVFGSTVLLLDEDDEAEITYQIVGDDEAEIREGRISYTSPIARALIGKREGDAVSVRTPAGDRNYEILEVLYK